MTLTTQKTDLRKSMRSALAEMSVQDRSILSEKIEKRLSDFVVREQGTWAGYQPMVDEPALNWSEVSKQITWAFPEMKGRELIFKKSSTQFVKKGSPVLEPVDGEEVSLNHLGAVVVPALGFDRRGYRLGRGQGYYDRTLKNYSGRKIGVCFSLALHDEIPSEEHDIPFDVIMTDLETIVLRK